MTHYDLCKITAKRFLKDSGNNIALYEYQSCVSGEHPDVLIYGIATTLYEIKMSKSDFKADANKNARKKWKTKYYIATDYKTGKLYSKAYEPKFKWNEKPHLGKYRYYVCESGLIQPKEVGHWGLYWYKSGKFYLKKRSDEFVRNIHGEHILISHAFRKYASLEDVNVIVKEYSKMKQ